MKKSVRTHLIEERKQRYWSQQEIADRLGTTRNTISRWEAGLTAPGPYFRARLCMLFGKTAQELGLIVPHLPASTFPGTATPAEPPLSLHASVQAVWTVPYGRNPQFTGRDEVLAQLDHHFSQTKSIDSTLPLCAALTQPQALKGLGGIGKTQIAIEYTHRAREQGNYTHILWINAAGQEAILSSFVTLAELLPGFSATQETDQQKVVEAVKRWLEQCQEPWLLIFDNADEVSLLQPYVPRRGKGSLLLTTRSHAVGSLAVSVEVENMGVVEGTTFLLRRAQRQHAGDDERDEATNVVIALDGFPLALDQAGAYIEETGCSFADYLQTYQEHHRALLARRGKQVANYPDSVATTWSLSFQKIGESNPAAIDLLRLCAYLSPDTIPEELLVQGAAFWPTALQQAVKDRFSFQGMLEDLLRFSLVKRQVEERLLRLHRLVQIVQRDTMAAEEQRQWAERVVCALNAEFPRDPKEDVASWPQCLRYLEQVQACDALIGQHRLLLPEAADLLDRAGIYFHGHASYALAEPLYRRAMCIREQTLGPHHAQVATSLNNLAILYKEQGRYTEAEPLYQQALRIREQALGPEHPLVASSLNGLANIYYHQGKYAQAEPLFQRALRIREQVLGPEHLLVATSLNNLADISREQGKYERAEALFQRALCIQEQLGPDHIKVASSLNNLSILYLEQERYAEAESLLQQALLITERQLGPEHPQVFFPLLNLGELCGKQGKYAEAESLLQRALLITERQLGPEHPRVAYVLTRLANLYREQGTYLEAEPLYQRALSMQEQTLEAYHPDTAETLHEFATLRTSQGNLEGAIALYQHALTVREQTYGSQHPKTTQTRERLQAVARALGGTEEMEKNAEASGELRSVLPSCPHCQRNSAVVKSGCNKSGSQRFRCQCCRHYFTPQAIARGYKSIWKEQAMLLAEQGKSYRFIARQLGVNHRTIRAWITVRKQYDDRARHE